MNAIKAIRSSQACLKKTNRYLKKYFDGLVAQWIEPQFPKL